jgi:hypothetical protein
MPAGEAVGADLGDDQYRLFCRAKQDYVDHLESLIVRCRVVAACAFLGGEGVSAPHLVSKPPLAIHGYSPVNGSLSGTKLAAFRLVILVPEGLAAVQAPCVITGRRGAADECFQGVGAWLPWRCRVAGDHRGGYLAVLTPDPVGVVGVDDRMRIAQPGARMTTEQVPLGI